MWRLETTGASKPGSLMTHIWVCAQHLKPADEPMDGSTDESANEPADAPAYKTSILKPEASSLDLTSWKNEYNVSE